MSVSPTPRTAAQPAPLSFTVSRRLLKFMSTELLTPSNHPAPGRPLLLQSFSDLTVYSTTRTGASGPVLFKFPFHRAEPCFPRKVKQKFSMRNRPAGTAGMEAGPRAPPPWPLPLASRSPQVARRLPSAPGPSVVSGSLSSGLPPEGISGPFVRQAQETQNQGAERGVGVCCGGMFLFSGWESVHSLHRV